jgi:hypothetical protein
LQEPKRTVQEHKRPLQDFQQTAQEFKRTARSPKRPFQEFKPTAQATKHASQTQQQPFSTQHSALSTSNRRLSTMGQSLSIAQQLNRAYLAVNNTLNDPEILALVQAYGYDAVRLDAGRDLHARAVEAVARKAQAAGAQRDTTAQANAAWRNARDAYQALAQIARAAFVRERAKLAMLGLKGREPQDTAGFLAAGYMLFDNALGTPEILAVLAGYGYDMARLVQERARLVAFDEANRAQEAAKGAAADVAGAQRKALGALRVWLAAYVKVARVALRGRRELLRKLGV